MNRTIPFLLGLAAGAAVFAVVAALLMPTAMLKEKPSPLGLDETVTAITNNAVGLGWVVAGIKPLEESVKKHGGGEVLPVRLVELCQPHHAAAILSNDQARVVSVMMPCTVAVYEKTDGKVYVATMNAGLLGRLFGGVVGRVMGGAVAGEQAKIVDLGSEAAP